jgi:NAD+ synthase
MRVALAQINVTVGDIDGNLARIHAAAATDADAVAFPELAICGYPPEDLILRPSFVEACMAAAERLARETATGPALIVGCPWREGEAVYNAALLLQGGRIAHKHYKRCLPNYGVFDERRIFTAGTRTEVCAIAGERVALMICEEIWSDFVPHDIVALSPDRIIVINASPYEAGKYAHRVALAQRVAAQANAPLHYVNLVGGQDDIVFDGGSFALDTAGGRLCESAAQFAEVVIPNALRDLPALDANEEIWNALVLGLRDYVDKNRFRGVLLGLSGGIDSAVVAALAVDALGAQRVQGVRLPSRLTSRASMDDAQASADLLGIELLTVPIEAAKDVVHANLKTIIPDAQRDSLLVDGNIQSRLRGLHLMALSNAGGRMLLNTGNKSEVAVGYTTLYGDACGGYTPIKDVYKTKVWELARWRNGRGPVIPENSIMRAPSAELAPGQLDEDQLPPYAVLDAVLARFIEGRESVAEIVGAGFACEVVEKVAGMVRAAEYKRRQLPPGAKVSPMLFGRDWRYPLTSGFKG